MGLAPEDAVTERMPYNETRDIAFFNASKIRYHKATPSRFFLFFPSDIHQPSVDSGKKNESRKVVVKIKYK